MPATAAAENDEGCRATGRGLIVVQFRSRGGAQTVSDAGHETVAVFSASGRPGQAQVRQLRRAGYRVRAITRQPDAIPEPDVEIVPADLNDRASLARACEGAAVVFFTSPSFTAAANAAVHATRLGEASRDAGIRRLVYNTTSWHPEEPIGVPSMDWSYEKTAALRATGVPLTVVRPSLFMDNLLTRWVKPYILERGEFPYPHRPDLEVSWICLDDVARLMIATLERDEFLGETLDVGGPETLRPPEVARLLSETLGRQIVYRQITPREFGERMYDVFKDVSGLDRETYVWNLERHYLFKNETNPFHVDMRPVLERIPIRLTPMREWLPGQNWLAEQRELVGSVSG
jgi:uncharacterized protein YbjT (DUF2867 family)